MRDKIKYHRDGSPRCMKLINRRNRVTRNREQCFREATWQQYSEFRCGHHSNPLKRIRIYFEGY